MEKFLSHQPVTVWYALGSGNRAKFASFRFSRCLPVHLILGYTAQEQPIVKLFIKGMDLLCLLRTYLLNLLNTQARLCLFRN